MDIPAYLSEVEYSVDGILSMIWHEHADLATIQSELAALTHTVKTNYQQAEFVAMNAEDLDGVAMATGMHYQNYFGDDKKRHSKATEASELKSRIDARSFSIDSLCESLLQIAKQGISVAHGGISKCPNGRDVSGHHLKEVIWQGRNQSIHWEEGNPHTPVQRLFDSLSANVDPKFADYRTRNCAFDIVQLLKWKTTEDFKDDMNLLRQNSCGQNV